MARYSLPAILISVTNKYEEIIMSRGFQRFIVQGNLGNDPDIRFMPNGDQVTNISLATTEVWKDNQGVEQKHTEWHKVVLYRKLAEVAGKHLRKGQPTLVEGKIKTRKWKDQAGNDRYTQEVIADGLTLMSSGTKYNDDGQSPKAGYQKPASENLPEVNKIRSNVASKNTPHKNATHDKSFEEMFPEDDEPPY